MAGRRGRKLTPPPKEPSWKLITINIDRGLLRRLDDACLRANETRIALIERWIGLGLDCEETRLREQSEIDRRVREEFERREAALRNGGLV